MNGLCGGGNATGTSSAGVASLQERGMSITALGSPSRRPGSGSCSTASMTQMQDTVRKSRSQGGKKLQKCFSTASYGEESSLRLQMTPVSQNNQMTRQYCSFGSTTSRIYSLNSIILFFLFLKIFFNHKISFYILFNLRFVKPIPTYNRREALLSI